ncbi:hypothetical protein G9A89_005667 [Geosiphon pyriformis]|nr:hypothetical protein G9A89_005667 [Geosiphon pyriformis]
MTTIEAKQFLERIQNILESTKDLFQELENDPEKIKKAGYGIALGTLGVVLEESKAAIGKYSECNFVNKLLQASKFEKNFRLLEERLDQACANLNEVIDLERIDFDQDSSRNSEKTLVSFNSRTLFTPKKIKEKPIKNASVTPLSRKIDEKITTTQYDDENFHHYQGGKDITWLEAAIKEELVKFIEYKHFSDIKYVTKGGFGVIHRAVWRRRQVALKRLDRSIVSNVEGKYEEFVRELKLSMKVKDDNRVVTFYGLSQDPNTKEYMMVMQYADGGNLRGYLKKNFLSLTWEAKKGLAYEIANGLAYIHDENIVHRDLHSKNILMHHGKPLITDFGLSKKISGADDLSLHSSVTGILAYVPPERLTDHPSPYDTRSDIYSFGVIMWEISAGRAPFPKSNDSLIFSICNGKRETPIIGTPIAYHQLYSRCWDFDPERRPTMDEILNELEQMPFLPVIEKEEKLTKFASVITEEPENLNESSNKTLREFSSWETKTFDFFLCDMETTTCDRGIYE